MLCAHTDTLDALKIRSWKIFYLLTLCKEIFLKEIIVCIKKSPPSCKYYFPWSSPPWQNSCRLGVCGHGGLGFNTGPAVLWVHLWDASCNSYKNKHKIEKKNYFCHWTIRLGWVASTHKYIYICVQLTCSVVFDVGISTTVLLFVFLQVGRFLKKTLVKPVWVSENVIKEKQKQQNKIKQTLKYF